jgi:hypothetical protein
VTKYNKIKLPNHHRAGTRGTVREHIVIAEKALGRQLPKKAVVHHHDRNGFNNVGGNLVVCPDQSYHLLLHARMRAQEACGNADWKRCIHCHGYDDPKNMKTSNISARNTPRFYHLDCNNEVARKWRSNRKIRPEAGL